MKRNYYIFTPGQLKRKENTIFFIPFKDYEIQEDENYQNDVLLSIDSDIDDLMPSEKIVIPIQDIDSFSIMSDVTFNNKFLDFCNQNNIPIHFFNYYGFYSGTYYPREYLLSGNIIVHQVKHYTSKEKRIRIAKQFIIGASYNIIKNLKYYNSRSADLSNEIQTIENYASQIIESQSIPDLMGIEGNIRKEYYSTFEKIIDKEYAIIKRKYNPPTNPINAIISYTNSLVYTTVLSEIYRTQLNPTISFLHEPSDRRFSLALDIAEIFKPIFADRVIFKLLNNRQIQANDFESKLNGMYIKDTGRKVITKEFDDKMKTVIKHKKLNREVSYRRIIRLECYKLVKHILGDAEYEPFKIWW